VAPLLYIIDPVRELPWRLHFRERQGQWLALVGWQTPPEVVDAGPHAEVIDTLAAALARVGRVTFGAIPDGPHRPGLAWEADEAGDWRSLLPVSGWQRLRGRRPLPLVSTTRAETARTLFEATGFPWTQAAQAVFLSPRDVPPPPLQFEQVVSVLDAVGMDAGELALDRSIRGLALPGPDGDFMELVGFDERLVPELEAALRAEAEARGGELARRDRLVP
jgi:hypothetical protein